jgi:hypothetical protein
MSAVPVSIHRRLGLVATIAAASTALAILAAGCASASTQGGPLHPVNVEVDNNLPIPTNITVYLIEVPGARRQLGDVPGGETKTLQFTPTSLSQEYRLLAERPLARPLRSQPFTIGDDMTGTIVGTRVPNIVGFRDVPDTTTQSPTATTH